MKLPESWRLSLAKELAGLNTWSSDEEKAAEQAEAWGWTLKARRGSSQ